MNASAEPAISPLAQRLAEENNVDWRTLVGSSAGGAVNERDVLDYLEAVMLGNRPLDPTPEPLPEGVSAWPEETAHRPHAERAKPAAAAPPTPPAPPAAPVKTFETEYRAALAELEALKAELVKLKTLKAELADADTHAAALKSKLAGLEAERTTWQGERLELGRLREDSKGQEAALVKAKALGPQVAELQEALAKAQGETRKAQEHGFELAARLNKLNDAQSKAETENKRLKEANAGLEQARAALQNRPWWKFWG